MRRVLLRSAQANPDTEGSFGFVIHPSDYQHLKRILRYISIMDRNLPEPLVQRFLFHLPPLEILCVPFNFFGLERRALCWGLLCPLLPIQMVTAERAAISKVLAAIERANDLGCKIVGLGGFTSIIGSGGLEIAKRSNVPVTSGNTYTAAVIIQSVRKAAAVLDLDLSEARVAVIGATGDIGSACVRELVKSCGSMVLVARNEKRLERLLCTLNVDSHRVEVNRRPSEAAASADIVITVTSAVTTILDPEALKTGAIVCDASYPANILKEIRGVRDDLLVYEGGIVEWPGLWEQVPVGNPFWRFNAPVGVHGCFAETLLLALENLYSTYSIGRGDISPDRIAAMLSIAEKYGFRPARFWHGDGGYTDQEIDRIRNARLRSSMRAVVNSGCTRSRSK